MAILFVLVSTKFKTCSRPNTLITCESVERISLKWRTHTEAKKNNNHEHNNKYATKQLDNNDEPSTLIMSNFIPTSKVSNKALTFFRMLHYEKDTTSSNFQM